MWKIIIFHEKSWKIMKNHVFFTFYLAWIWSFWCFGPNIFIEKCNFCNFWWPFFVKIIILSNTIFIKMIIFWCKNTIFHHFSWSVSKYALCVTHHRLNMMLFQKILKNVIFVISGWQKISFFTCLIYGTFDFDDENQHFHVFSCFFNVPNRQFGVPKNVEFFYSLIWCFLFFGFFHENRCFRFFKMEK